MSAFSDFCSAPQSCRTGSHAAAHKQLLSHHKQLLSLHNQLLSLHNQLLSHHNQLLSLHNQLLSLHHQLLSHHKQLLSHHKQVTMVTSLEEAGIDNTIQTHCFECSQAAMDWCAMSLESDESTYVMKGAQSCDSLDVTYGAHTTRERDSTVITEATEQRNR